MVLPAIEVRPPILTRGLLESETELQEPFTEYIFALPVPAMFCFLSLLLCLASSTLGFHCFQPYWTSAAVGFYCVSFCCIGLVETENTV